MPVQPETERSLSQHPETAPGESSSSFMRTLTGPIARVVFALPFFVFGINHFAMTGQIAGGVPEWLPGAGSYFWVYLTGVIHLAASVAIMANRLIQPAGILLAAMLLTFVFTVHIPGLSDPDTMATAMTNLLKDTALAGGALMAAHFAYHRHDETGESETESAEE